MALKSGLALYAYTLTTPSAIVEYAAQFETLELTTLAPGGCGAFTGKLKLPDSRLPRPELAPFARLAVMDPSMPAPSQCVWIGEIGDPELGMTVSDGEYVLLRALGLGATIRDDPRNVTYNNQTAPAIVKSEMSSRAAYLPIDADTSQVFPDNPAATFSPAYTGRNMEDVVADVATLAGDYSWGTWPHPLNRDTAGFPTGQLVVHARDTSTIAYTAQMADITGWRITPSLNRAYNVIEVGYSDPSQAAPVGAARYKDSRLNSDNSTGTAPFRYRKYLRDLAGVATVTKAQGQAIANTFGAQYQNLTNTIEITLAGLRDAYGNPIPLWQAWADRNIYIPELAVRGTPLPTGATAGINLFYIRGTRYTEDQSGTQQLVLTCDNFEDRAELMLARLQLAADVQARQGLTTTSTVQALGAPLQGSGGAQMNPTGAGENFGVVVDYGATLSQNSTSLTLAATVANNAASFTGTNQGVLGFLLGWTAAASTLTTAIVTWTTVGNCLLDVDEARGTFAHHCDTCEVRMRDAHGCREGCADCREQATRRGLSLTQHVRVHTTDRHGPRGAEPGFSSLNVDCPHCLAAGVERVESFSTALTAADEDAALFSAHHARQAHLVRRIMRHRGLATRD